MSLPFDRIYNFSAGPAVLPVEVLEQCRDEMLDFRGSGMSVMEMSHRSSTFEGIIGEAESDLRALLGIPDNYKVLFLQGGASLQFTMVAKNLLCEDLPAKYVVTGSWGKKAVESAALEGRVETIFDGGKDYRSIPPDKLWANTADASYIHVTTNETIHGVELGSDPDCGSPLVADMSSDILSRPVDVSKYGLIYAGAQKNMGPAGLTVVIIREDLLERSGKGLPPMLDYKLQAKNNSLYNTPPAWCIYVTGLVYKHLLKSGGMTASSAKREQKAAILYGAIDSSHGFFRGHSNLDSRSRMNVVFTLAKEDLTARFVAEAEAKKMSGLEGHRSVGGCRASIYDAFPLEGCELLRNHMQEFAKSHG